MSDLDGEEYADPILDEIFHAYNKVRTDPKSIIPYLESREKYGIGRSFCVPGVTVRDVEGPYYIQEAIKFIGMRKLKHTALIRSKALDKAAQKHADDYKENKIEYHTGTDGKTQTDRIQDVVEGSTLCDESFKVGEYFQGEDFVMDLFLDQYNPEKTNRVNIFDVDFKYIGIAIAENSETMLKMAVVTLCDKIDNADDHDDSPPDVKFDTFSLYNRAPYSQDTTYYPDPENDIPLLIFYKNFKEIDGKYVEYKCVNHQYTYEFKEDDGWLDAKWDCFEILNKLRTDPQYFIPYLKHLLNFYEEDEGRLAIPGHRYEVFEEGSGVICDAIKFLEEKEPVHALIRSDALCKASQDHADDVNENEITGYEGTDGSDPYKRIERYCKYDGEMDIIMKFVLSRDPLDFILRTLFNDDDPDRAQRKTLFSEDLNYVGFGAEKHTNGEFVLVINFLQNISGVDSDDHESSPPEVCYEYPYIPDFNKEDSSSKTGGKKSQNRIAKNKKVQDEKDGKAIKSSSKGEQPIQQSDNSSCCTIF